MRRLVPILLTVVLFIGCATGGSYGIYHKIKRGETLSSIARMYGSSVDKITESNTIADARALQPGDWIFVPGAKMPQRVSSAKAVHSKSKQKGVSASSSARKAQSLPVAGTKKVRFIWPMKGVVTSPFGRRWGRMHEGIDIGAPVGTPIYAAAAGKVVYAARKSSYGKVVIIQHPGNWFTVYAHNSALLVPAGKMVKQGEMIAKCGQTGRATGPHLHFEIRKGAKPLDPLTLLPKAP